MAQRHGHTFEHQLVVSPSLIYGTNLSSDDRSARLPGRLAHLRRSWEITPDPSTFQIVTSPHHFSSVD
jgi:hypothetical protein